MAWAALPVAAAVVGVITIIARRREYRPPRAVSPALAANAVSVDVHRGQQATVFATRDPRVTIIWLSQEGGN